MIKDIIYNNRPRVSIITVCFNEGSDIENTCKSVVSQTYNNYEWIIVDGGSTDGTLQVLDKYKSNISVLISEKDDGVYDAMNKGIKAAKGEYLLFLNGGDYLLEENILDKVFLNNDYREGVIFGDAEYLSKDGKRTTSNFSAKVGKNYFLEKSICHQAAFIKRILFKKYGVYDSNYKIVGDWEKWIVFNRNNVLFKKISIVIAVHKHFDGLSTAKNEKIWVLHLREENLVLAKYFPIMRFKKIVKRIIGERRYRKTTRILYITAKEFYSRLINKVKKSYNFISGGINFFFKKERSPLIVSLTSFPERIPILHICLESILNQKMRPGKVILWLSNQEFPDKEEGLPENVLRLRKEGLIIRFCDNIKSYKKLIPAIKEYPDDIIVTADDDIRYPSDWLGSLYLAYREEPDAVNCHRANLIKLRENGELKPFLEFDSVVNAEKSSIAFANLISGCGGVLYPPGCFYKDILNEDLFLKICPNADDMWFWAMAVLNGKKINVIKNNIYEVDDLLPDKTKGKHLWNSNGIGGNDEQLNGLLNYYPELREIISSK